MKSKRDFDINDITLEHVYQFIETGDPLNAPPEIVQYLEILSAVHTMSLRIDIYGSREIILKDLMVRYGVTHGKASTLYNEAIEYFYAEKETSKRAYGNFYASIVDKVINFSLLSMKDSADAKRITDMVKVAAELRGVFEEEELELPKEMFRKPFVIYSTSFEELGLQKADIKKLRSMNYSTEEINEIKNKLWSASYNCFIDIVGENFYE
jgi:hypothetical protein